MGVVGNDFKQVRGRPAERAGLRAAARASWATDTGFERFFRAQASAARTAGSSFAS